MPLHSYDVCFPDSRTVIRSFPSLLRARDFMRVMSAEDVPFLVMPWEENSMPLIVKRVKTPRKYQTQKAVKLDILGPSQQKG